MANGGFGSRNQKTMENVFEQEWEPQGTTMVNPGGIIKKPIRVPQDLGMKAIKGGMIGAALGILGAIIYGMVEANKPPKNRPAFDTPNLRQNEGISLDLTALIPYRCVDTDLFDGIVDRTDQLCGILLTVHQDPRAGTLIHLPIRAKKLSIEIQTGLRRLGDLVMRTDDETSQPKESESGSPPIHLNPVQQKNFRELANVFSGDVEGITRGIQSKMNQLRY